MPTGYVQKWEDFFENAIDICLNDPFKSRVCLKYKNSYSLAIVKVTDGKKTLLYKCKEEADIKKIDGLFRVATQILANIEEEIPQQSDSSKPINKKTKKQRG